MTRDFAEKYIKPNVMEWDESLSISQLICFTRWENKDLLGVLGSGRIWRVRTWVF